MSDRRANLHDLPACSLQYHMRRGLRGLLVALAVLSLQTHHAFAFEDFDAIGHSSSSSELRTCSSKSNVACNSAGASDDQATLDRYQQLRQWAHNVSGFEPLVKVDEICHGSSEDHFCLRGLVAIRDIKAGELVSRLPPGYYITLAEADGVSLLERIYQDPAFNSTFATWLAVLPGEFMTPESMTDLEIEMVQGTELGKRYAYQKKVLRDAFDVDVKNSTSVVAENNIGWDEYAHAYMTLATRYWAFTEERPAPNGNGTIDVSISTLLPLMDMANHDDTPNAYVTKSGDMAVTYASADIPQGAELTIVYQNSQLHRPDVAMLHYGYLPKAVPPLLLAYDLGGEGSAELRANGASVATPENDDDYKLGGPLCHSAELARLMGTLTSFPTTEAEDGQLLQTGQLTDRERVLVEMRMERKAALSYVVARLTDGIKEWKLMTERTKDRWDYGNFNISSMYHENLTDTQSDTAPDSLRMDWTTAREIVAEYEESQKAADA